MPKRRQSRPVWWNDVVVRGTLLATEFRWQELLDLIADSESRDLARWYLDGTKKGLYCAGKGMVVFRGQKMQFRAALYEMVGETELAPPLNL